MARFEPEPILRLEDKSCWATWWKTACVHSRSIRFRRRLNQAQRVVDQCLSQCENTAVMWSGGKDSTVLAHLVTRMDPSVSLVSEKDDLDYPGERDYVEGLAEHWSAQLEVITPQISPCDWIDQNAHLLNADDDFHSRAAELSKACFYGLVEEANAGRDAVFLGLRKGESRGRMMNRITRGLLYRKRPTEWNPSGLTVCTPLGDWSGLDVYAYLARYAIDPLPVYRCVWLNHREEPWRVRKSWWIPGADSRWGGIAWLRHYWPSLYQRLLDWWPMARRLT